MSKAMSNDLLTELTELCNMERLRPDDVTIRRLTARSREAGAPVSDSKARRVLDHEIEAGRLVRMRCINDDGRIEYAYRPKP